MNRKKIIILTPVYNDWASFEELYKNLVARSELSQYQVSLIVIDDASTEDFSPEPALFDQSDPIISVKKIQLNCNLGHQRAIALGLSYINKNEECDAVLILDADGEDKVSDVLKLLQCYVNNPDFIITARRYKRSEGFFFKVAYCIYKLIFLIVTGRKITFGNFCVIPMRHLKKLVYMDTLWNHLAASILKSKLPLLKLDTERGQRYMDKPKMNLSALVLLGLSAASVYGEIIFLRALCAALFMSFITLIAMLIVFFIRLFTALAIPGWASAVFGSLSIIFILSLILSIFILFMTLSNRSRHSFIPAIHYEDYILRDDVLK